MPRQIKVTESVYARLKELSKRSDRSMASLVGDLVKLSHKKEVKNVGEEKDTEVWTCDECEEKIPSDAVFCPYCGVEFEEVEEEDEDEDED